MRTKRGTIFFTNVSEVGRGSICFFYPNTAYVAFRVKVLAGWDVLLTQAVTGVWRRGSHTPNKLEKARKRETRVTPVRAEVLVCVRNSNYKLVKA